MNELGIGVTILVSVFIIASYLFKLKADDKLTEGDINYIKAMNIIKNKECYSKIEIQKAYQQIDNYLEYKKQTRNN